MDWKKKLSGFQGAYFVLNDNFIITGINMVASYMKQWQIIKQSITVDQINTNIAQIP